MNLDKASAANTTAPLAPPEWTMEVQKDGIQFTADIKRAGELICRISVARTDSDESAARAVLADKARTWIRGFLDRRPG